MFHPGETVSHIFTIPFVKTEVSKVIVTYKQNDHIIIVKTITSETIEAVTAATCKVTVAFNQEESLLFEEDKPFKMQLNVVGATLEGSFRAASKEISSNNGVQHYKEVI